MSWQIPTQVEQDIIAGKATYRTFQTGNGGQSILPVPANSYVVIFGYDFSPAGSGVANAGDYNMPGSLMLPNNNIYPFGTQQLSFFTGSDFYPFIHHVELKQELVPYEWDAATDPANVNVTKYKKVDSVQVQTISRQVYIVSSQDVSITHGLIRVATRISANNIPVTSRTPVGLTYGGSGISTQTQTNYGPGGTPLQFMQPSPKDYQDFGFGLLPANADGQAYATPDTTNGLVPVDVVLAAISGATLNIAAAQYYVNCHYALYNKTIPNKQG